MEFLCAAILWFDDLDRDTQIALLIAGEASVYKPRHVHFRTPIVIGRVARSWSFPIHSLGQVLGAAAAGFCDVGGDQQREYVLRMMGEIGG